MGKRLPKVIVDGEEKNACPLCGVGVSVSAWNKWKMCIDCNKLIRQGMTVEKAKRIRMNELSSKVLANDQVSEQSPEVNLEDDVNVIYKKQSLYNFKTTFPAGLRIVVRDNEEAKYLQEVYGYYAHYGENVPEFNVLISGILQAKLDLFRNSKEVSDVNLPYTERKGVKEIDIKLGDQINKTTRVLDDLKDRIDSQSGNIITSKFASMLQYLHECEHEYMGVGICKQCNTRIIFKTNFPTFKTWMLEKLDEIEQNDKIELDKRTKQIILKAIRGQLDDISLAKTYITDHVRQLESSMIEGGINI